jgi:hypothetical protein
VFRTNSNIILKLEVMSLNLDYIIHPLFQFNILSVGLHLLKESFNTRYNWTRQFFFAYFQLFIFYLCLVGLLLGSPPISFCFLVILFDPCIDFFLKRKKHHIFAL